MRRPFPVLCKFSYSHHAAQWEPRDGNAGLRKHHHPGTALCPSQGHPTLQQPNSNVHAWRHSRGSSSQALTLSQFCLNRLPVRGNSRGRKRSMTASNISGARCWKWPKRSCKQSASFLQSISLSRMGLVMHLAHTHPLGGPPGGPQHIGKASGLLLLAWYGGGGAKLHSAVPPVSANVPTEASPGPPYSPAHHRHPI